MGEILFVTSKPSLVSCCLPRDVDYTALKKNKETFK